MRHRHLNPGFEDSAAAVADVLDRGTVADWRELARHVREDPFGPYATAVERVLTGPHLYGTTVLWTRYLAGIQQQARQGAAAAPAGSDPTR
ncbi:MAG: hypothetical protein M0Z54_04960 [Thermaerobacter sp.]|nr:hypothetical protein [Thermaerobacter sp.]